MAVVRAHGTVRRRGEPSCGEREPDEGGSLLEMRTRSETSLAPARRSRSGFWRRSGSKSGPLPVRSAREAQPRSPPRDGVRRLRAPSGRRSEALRRGDSRGREHLLRARSRDKLIHPRAPSTRRGERSLLALEIACHVHHARETRLVHRSESRDLEHSFRRASPQSFGNVHPGQEDASVCSRALSARSRRCKSGATEAVDDGGSRFGRR
jgi:hypothetical protein